MLGMPIAPLVSQWLMVCMVGIQVVQLDGRVPMG
jgi:hypothetical protein